MGNKYYNQIRQTRLNSFYEAIASVLDVKYKKNKKYVELVANLCRIAIKCDFNKEQKLIIGEYIPSQEIKIIKEIVEKYKYTEKEDKERKKALEEINSKKISLYETVEQTTSENKKKFSDYVIEAYINGKPLFITNYDWDTFYNEKFVSIDYKIIENIKTIYIWANDIDY